MESVGQRGGIRISDRSGEEVSVPQKGDPPAVRRPGWRASGEPEPQHRGILVEIEEVDPPAVGAIGDRHDPAPVGGDGCPGDAAASVAEDVFEGEGHRRARFRRVGGAAAAGEGKADPTQHGPQRESRRSAQASRLR